jgi:hypothetical protein
MPQINFLPVNWVDGMKINKSHFIAQDNAMLFQLAQHTASLLNELNYGLLPGVNETAAPQIVVSTDSEKKIQVRLRHCRAITAGGHYIEFSESTNVTGDTNFPPVVSKPASLKELKEKASEFYLVLTINPYQRVPFGVMSQVEQPARTPFAIPTVFIDMVPVTELAKNVLGVFQLPVGKLSIEGQRIIVDEEYVPPCTSVNSHPDLLEIHASLEQFYSKMEVYALQIIQKINQKKQINDMSLIVQKLCENILFFTAGQMSELKSTGHVQTPVYITTKAAHLARLIKNTLDCYYGNGKEELINYFTEWGGNSQGELEGVIVQLSAHQYNHLDIIASVDHISRFTKLISKLFHQLARLEYIGKRKETGIFVKEEVVRQNNDNPPPKRRSFLAD